MLRVNDTYRRGLSNQFSLFRKIKTRTAMSFITLKKIFFLAMLVLACNSNDPKGPVTSEEEQFTQYGTPFAAVPDPKNIVLYEVNIRAFSSTGDLQGVINRLDNIKALGCNTIWLMPIHPVGQERSAGGLGSPYAVRNYREVNPEFGDLTKLRELVDAAHQRNMSIIIDWVANHTSWDNPWIANKSWYTQDTNGNIIPPAGTNWQDVADLNYNSMDMRRAMIQAMKYWVMEANIDGFRCDAVDLIPTDFWSNALDELKTLPNRKLILLAEGGKVENFHAGFQLNYAWDFCSNIGQVYKNNLPATSIFTVHQQEYNAIPQGAVKLRYTTNHDLSAWEATPVEVFGGEQAALSASVITIFTSAAPMIYSGQEVGREEKLPFFTKDPINWNDNQEILDSYEKLFSIYNQSAVFTNGTLVHYPNPDIAAFTRTSGNDQYLVVVNVRNTQKTWTVDNAVKNSQWTNAIDGSSFALGTSLNISPFGYYVLKK
jgi:glycosidase